MKYLLPAGLTVIVLVLGQFFLQHETVNVERVVDGDTVDVENDTVRFIGIDTAETSNFTENKPGEYGLENTGQNVECLDKYGLKASEFVKEHVGDNTTLIYDRRSESRGDYGRKLAYVRDDGDLNRKLLVEGLARVYPSKFSRKNEFYFWQHVARKTGRGIWSC